MKPQTSLDPDVVNLAKAIRQTESGGNFNAIGKSQERGAYQFLPDTWNTWSQKYGINTPLEQATPEQQNEVAYKQIKEWKDQGLNVGQVASMWNSGKPDWQGNVGVNKFGVKYDTPQYVDSVAQAYQQLKQGNQNPEIIPNASTADNIAAPTDNRDWLQKTGDVVNAIFPGKQVGEAIGTLAGYALSPNKDQYDLSAPTPLQVAGDVAQGALMVGGLPGTGATTALGRIGENAVLGGAFNATGAIAGGSTNPLDIAKQGLIGGVIGGGAGVLGEGLAKIADVLPRRLISSALPKLKNPETIEYALNNLKFGTMENMINTSQESLNHYEKQIQTVLNHPQYAGETVNGGDIMNSVMESFPRSEYTLDTVISKLKTQVPSEAATLTKLGQGKELNLEEANTLRKAIDKTTYKLTIDSPEVKAGKDLAAAVGNSIRIQVQTKAPESVPIFQSYAKEVNLFKALKKAGQAKSGRSVITFKDLYGILGGGALGGIPGSVAGAAVENIASKPAVKIATAKLLNKSVPVAKTVASAVKTAGALVPGRIAANQGKTNQ